MGKMLTGFVIGLRAEFLGKVLFLDVVTELLYFNGIIFYGVSFDRFTCY